MNAAQFYYGNLPNLSIVVFQNDPEPFRLISFLHFEKIPLGWYVFAQITDSTNQGCRTGGHRAGDAVYGRARAGVGG